MTPRDPNRPDLVLCDLPARGKSDVVEALAARVAVLAGVDPIRIARALADRETLGSTGVGAGVALPHATIADLAEPVVIFVRLARSIDWEAIDDRPVDLVLAVLSPAATKEVSLPLLATFSRRLRNDAVRRRLRQCTGESDLMACFDDAG